MNKTNMLFYIIGVVCIVVAGYILVNKFFENNDINFEINEDEELFNSKLSEIGLPLGWIILVDGINNRDSNGNYVVTFNEDLFDNYEYRQLFAMEYILSITNDYDDFIVIDMEDNVVDDELLVNLL